MGRCHILLQEAKYLVLKKFETVAFSHHFAYQVEPLEDFILLCDIAGISQVLLYSPAFMLSSLVITLI